MITLPPNDNNHDDDNDDALFDANYFDDIVSDEDNSELSPDSSSDETTETIEDDPFADDPFANDAFADDPFADDSLDEDVPSETITSSDDEGTDTGSTVVSDEDDGDDPFADDPVSNVTSDEDDSASDETDDVVSDSDDPFADDPFADDVSMGATEAEVEQSQDETDDDISEDNIATDDIYASPISTSEKPKSKRIPDEEFGIMANYPLLIVNNAPRQYDTATFELLTPQANDTAIVQCIQCDALYYNESWRRSRNCVRCGGKVAQAVEIPEPVPLTPATSVSKVLDVSQRIDLTKDAEGVVGSRQSIGAMITSALQSSSTILLKLARNTAIIVFLIGLVSFLSAHAFQIASLDFLDPTNVLDVLLRSETRPEMSIWISTVLVSVLTAYVFYPHVLRGSNQNVSFLRRVVRLVAALIIFAFFFIYAQGWSIFPFEDLYDSVDSYIFFDEWREDALGITAIAAASLTIVSTIIYRILSVRFDEPTGGYLATIISVTRYLIVVCGIAVVAIVFGINQLLPKFNNPDIVSVGFFDQSIPITYPALGALFVALAISTILFHRPNFQGNEEAHWGWRIIVLILCVGGFAVLYALTPNTEGLLEVIPFTAGFTAILLPVQRALS